MVNTKDEELDLVRKFSVKLDNIYNNIVKTRTDERYISASRDSLMDIEQGKNRNYGGIIYKPQCFQQEYSSKDVFVYATKKDKIKLVEEGFDGICSEYFVSVDICNEMGWK